MKIINKFYLILNEMLKIERGKILTNVEKAL